MLSVVSLLALAACSNDDSDSPTRVPLTVKATIQGANTRVQLDDDGAGYFTEGDEIKVDIPEAEKTCFFIFNGTDFVPKSASDYYYFGPDDTESIYIHAIFGEYNYEDNNKTIEPLEDVLEATATCSVRSPKAAFNFTHIYSKFTLKFSSAVTECYIIKTESDSKTTTYKCHLNEDGSEAEAYVHSDSYFKDLQVKIITSEDKTDTGSIDLSEIVSNTHYIYNIKINNVLTIEGGEQIQGFEDSGETFEVESNN